MFDSVSILKCFLAFAIRTSSCVDACYAVFKFTVIILPFKTPILYVAPFIFVHGTFTSCVILVTLFIMKVLEFS